MSSGKPVRTQRILSLAFASRHMGFVVAHDVDNLMDWGVKNIPRTDKDIALAKVQKLISHYQPALICIQNIKDSECRLGTSIITILSELKTVCAKQNVAFKAVSKRDVRENLELPDNACKQDVAAKVANMYPQLQNLLPPPRKLWEAEGRNTITLIACSMILTLT